MTTKQSILVVEPDVATLQIIADQILVPNQYTVFKAESANKALTVAANESPDLLLLHLPVEATFAFLSQMADSKCSIPTILIVDHTSTQINIELLRLGVIDYIPLPLTQDGLLQVLNRALHQSAANTNARMDHCQTLKYEFADMASHLLRNPLTVIQTSVRCLQTLDLTTEEQQKLLDKIWNQSEKLKGFTYELLKNLRFETEGAHFYPAPVSLLPMIERMLTIVKNEKPDLIFHYNSDEQPIPPVAADAAKTEIVLLNLLMSAVRRSFAGGTIAVSVYKNSTKIIVTVEDDGKPIPVKSLDEVFQPYYPVGVTDYNIPATYQLGLYTTKRLIELQNGRIWANSQPGKGTQFNFSLPIWEVKK